MIAAVAVACTAPEDDYSAWYDDDDKGSTEVPTTPVEGIDLSVMSFNVRFPSSEDSGEKSWSARTKGIYAMIKAKQPMVIGLQEAYLSQRNDITKNVEGYSAYGVGRTDGNQSGETTSILYNKSLFSLKDYGTFWLSQTPTTPSVGWGASTYRTATWVKLEMKSNGKIFFVVNTHLDHQSDQAKEEGLKLIQQKINDLNGPGYPVVLTGDFNEASTSSIFSALSLKNARNEASISDNFSTSNGWGTKNQQIDHIYFGNLDVVSYETIRDRWEGVTYISDHYPIMATFTFKK